MSSESVSIIIPAWNAAQFLERAIHSALTQTRKPDRVVVVDDGSTDETWQIILKMAGAECGENISQVRNAIEGVELIGLRKPHTNLPGTRNHGIAHVWNETTVFGFMDADDWYAPLKVERSLDVLALKPAIACVVSDYDDLRPDGRFYREYKPSFDDERLMQFNLHNINCLVRRSAFEAIGSLFNESLNYCEDYDLFLRLAEVGLIYHLPEVLHHRTEHGTNMSLNWDEMIRYEMLVKQLMARRRGLAT